MARVLIVEDEMIPRTVLEKVLTRDGYEVAGVASAQEAVDIAATFQPHILVADWLLTDSTSGLAVAEKLRAQNPKLHILFFTGLPTHALERQAEHLRPIQFLEKPCDFETLRSVLRKMATC